MNKAPTFVVQHVALPVTDLAAARRFYGETLGLREIARPEFDFDGAWYALGAQQLHLIVNPRALPLRGSRQIDSRGAHVALRVSDFDGVVAKLAAAGIELVEKRNNRTPWWQAFVADPDGNVIELNAERPAESD